MNTKSKEPFLSKEAIQHAKRLIALKWTKETDVDTIAGTWQAGYTFGQIDANKANQSKPAPQGVEEALDNIPLITVDSKDWLEYTGVAKLIASLSHPSSDQAGVEEAAKEFLEYRVNDSMTTCLYTGFIAGAGWQSSLNEGRPKIVCLCGSVKFANEFHKWEFDLSIQGVIVLTPCAYNNDVQITNPAAKKTFDQLHMRKIDMADEVFILNVGGYIGESTLNELNYALKIGKPVKYLEPLKEKGEQL